jgi:hypothetical protein
VDFARQLPEVLTRVIEIDDLHRARKMQVGLVPVPFGAIGYDDFLFRTIPPTVPSFQIDTLSELFGSLDGARAGGRIGIANRVAFCVPRGLGEDASRFGLARVGRMAAGFAFAPSVSFFTTGTPVPSICT